MQLVDALLQQFVDLWCRLDATFVDPDQERLDLVAEITHGADTRHAGAALECMQVSFQRFDVLA